MHRIYKAIDKLDSSPSSFFVHDDGRVAVKWAPWTRISVEWANYELKYDTPDRIDDMIDPVLIAEW